MNCPDTEFTASVKSGCEYQQNQRNRLVDRLLLRQSYYAECYIYILTIFLTLNYEYYFREDLYNSVISKSSLIGAF